MGASTYRDAVGVLFPDALRLLLALLYCQRAPWQGEAARGRELRRVLGKCARFRRTEAVGFLELGTHGGDSRSEPGWAHWTLMAWGCKLDTRGAGGKEAYAN